MSEQTLLETADQEAYSITFPGISVVVVGWPVVVRLRGIGLGGVHDSGGCVDELYKGWCVFYESLTALK